MTEAIQKSELRSVSYVYGLFAALLFGAFICFSAPIQETSMFQSSADLILLAQAVVVLFVAVEIWRQNFFFGYYLGFAIAGAYILFAAYNLVLGAHPLGPVLLSVFWIAAASNLYRSFALNRRAQNIKLPIQ